MLGLLSPWLASPQSAVGEISLSGPLNAKLLVYVGVLEFVCIWVLYSMYVWVCGYAASISRGGRQGLNVASLSWVSVDDCWDKKSKGNSMELAATFILYINAQIHAQYMSTDLW